MDHSFGGLSQWEATSLCNVVSHWLNPCKQWSLHVWSLSGKYFWENRSCYVGITLYQVHYNKRQNISVVVQSWIGWWGIRLNQPIIEFLDVACIEFRLLLTSIPRHVTVANNLFCVCTFHCSPHNTLRRRQNGRYFTNDIS